MYDIWMLQNRIEHPHMMPHRFLKNQHFLRLWMNPQFFHKIPEITQIVDFVRSDEASYEDVRCGFGSLKGHTFSP